MKKKILLGLGLVSMALLSVGGTVAYLTDNEQSTDVYTIGDINIGLLQNDVENGVVELMPGKTHDTYTRITNLGKNDAYVWLTVAIPSALDDAEDKAYQNILHWNTMGAFWNGYHTNTDYHVTAEAAYPKQYTYPVADEQTWIINNSEVEVQEIDGVSYNVYTLKYAGVLKPGETTTPGLSTVYLDTKVDYNEETGKWVLVEKGVETEIDHDFSKNTNVIVKAHAIQTSEFDSLNEAYAAYTAQWNEE